MVTIAKEEFNQDMDEYLSNRREKPASKSFFKDVTKMFKSSNTDDDYEEEYQAPKKKSYSFISAIFRRRRIPSEDEIENEIGTLDSDERKNLERIEGAIEDAEEVNEEFEEEREGLIKRFLKKLRIYRQDEFEGDEEIVQDVPMVDEDIKETLKILHYWLEQLSPEKKEQFKRSEDFNKYKNALRKMKLIKE